MKSFQGAVAVMTGGGSGIGRAVSLGLARRGATVVVADIDEASANGVAREIEQGGGRAFALALDVRDADAVEKLVRDAAAKHGQLDYLFNNAGIAIMGEERDVSLDDWRRVLDVDLNGVVYGVRAAYPIMVRQGHGHIVNTASLAGLIPAALEISYTAAKYAVVGLSHALRAEGAKLGVKVTVVCPGFIETPILRKSAVRTNVSREKFLAMIPKPMAASRCAEIVLDGVARNRATVVVTGHAKLLYLLHRISPSLTIRLAQSVVERVRAMSGDGRAAR